jgi:hypothetical protein
MKGTFRCRHLEDQNYKGLSFTFVRQQDPLYKMAMANRSHLEYCLHRRNTSDQLPLAVWDAESIMPPAIAGSNTPQHLMNTVSLQ